MKDEIIGIAKGLNIPLIGFTDNHCLEDLQEKIELSIKLGYSSPFIKGDIKERLNPNLILDSCQTIISIAVPYLKSCEQLEEIDNEIVYFSSSSWGEDYHRVLQNKMELLVEKIKEIFPSLEYKLLVDNHPLDDRYIAYKAGLGYYGLNNLLINDEFGSYIFIGNILTNLNLDNDCIQNKKCLMCMQCIENCPTKAIDTNNNLINNEKCLSYLTQKKELNENEEQQLNNCIYGCDICMKVCPHNNENNYSKEFEPFGIEFININNYSELTNKEWFEKYGKISGSWRGKKNINRNILIYKKRKNMIK